MGDKQSNEYMWNRILTIEVMGEMLKLSGEDESIVTLNQFFDFLKKKTEYKTTVILATQWKGLEDVKQANIAVKMVGMYQASRFIIMMDVLAKRFLEGKLK